MSTSLVTKFENKLIIDKECSPGSLTGLRIVVKLYSQEQAHLHS